MMKTESLERLTLADKPVIAALLLLVLALICRVYAAAASGIIAPDGIAYINTARMISSGDLQGISGFSFFSLYPFLIVVAQRFFGDWEVAGRSVSVILGSLTVIPLFLLTRRLISARVAFIASLLYAISPRFVEYSSDVLRESAFWFFAMSALWSAWEGLTRRSWLHLVLSSFFAGLSVFTRMEGIPVFLVIVSWSIYLFLRKDFDTKGLLSRLLVFLIALPIIFSPGLYFLKNRLGHWEFGLAGVKVPQLLEKGGGEVVKDEAVALDKTSAQFRSFLDIANRHKYLSYFAEVVYKFIKSFNVLFFMLLLFGLFRRRTIPYSKNEIAILIWFGIFFFTAYVYVAKTDYLSTRHGLLMAIPALLWAGIGFYELGGKMERWIRRMGRTETYSGFADALLLLIILVAIVPKTLSASGTDKVELKEAGKYLKKMNYADATFVGDPALQRVVFYADAKFVSLPAGLTFEKMENFLMKNHAQYLIVDKRTVDTILKDFQTNPVPGFLEKVSMPQLETYKEYSIDIYRVKG